MQSHGVRWCCRWAVWWIMLVISPVMASTESEMLRTKGVAAYQQGQLELALRHLNAAVQADDGDHQARYYNGLTNIRLGRYGDAIKMLLPLQTVSSSKFSNLPFEIGYAYYRSGEYASAISFLNQSLANDMNTIEANYYLGLSYYQLKQYQQAIAPLAKTSQQPGEFAPAAYYLLSRCYQRLEDKEKAKRYAEEGINAYADSAYADASRSLLSELKGEGGAQRWLFAVSGGLSYDSNVGLFPSEDVLSVDERSDVRAQGEFEGHYQQKLSDKQAWAASYRLYVSEHDEMDEFDLVNHRLNVAWVDAERWSVSGGVVDSRLDNQHFLLQWRITPSVKFNHGGERQSTLRFNWMDKRYQQNEHERYSSYQSTLSYRFQKPLWGKKYYQGYLGVELRNEDTAAAELEYYGLAPETGFSGKIAKGDLSIQLSYRWRDYHNDSSDREDKLLQLMLKYEYPLQEKLDLSLAAHYFDNDSSLSTFSYQRKVISANLRWQL